ncbi:MAG: glycosyltransferase family 4 protein [Candidatus Hydrogenedentota bacterium]
MRIAFVDLIFSWPPNGGADVHVFEVLRHLQAAGHDVHLFVVHQPGSFERGRIAPDTLPFPVTRIDATLHALAPERLCPRLRAAVDAFAPRAVFVTHGYTLKPYVLETFADYPLVSRYYAHEAACARDPLRFKAGAPCPCHALRTVQVCRECAVESQREALVSWQLATWQRDYLAAKAYAPAYAARARQALQCAHVLVVSNAAQRAAFAPFHPRIEVIPGGVDVAAYTPAPLPHAAKKVVFMAGRGEAPTKGLSVLLDAANRLRQHRDDFLVRATHFDPMQSRPGFDSIGWRTGEEMRALYADSYMVAVPSVWEEPFGLVAVEAMATGRPVLASQTGGLQDIVRHGETGLLVPPGDAEAWAGALEALLDNPALARRMGAAGRAMVEAEYDWHVIIERHLTPLLESLCHE